MPREIVHIEITLIPPGRSSRILMTRSRTVLAAMFVALPGAAVAQQLRGTVHVAGASVPLPGAVIAVIDSAGTQVARAIANAQGAFALALPPRPARIHVVR